MQIKEKYLHIKFPNIPRCIYFWRNTFETQIIVINVYFKFTSTLISVIHGVRQRVNDDLACMQKQVSQQFCSYPWLLDRLEKEFVHIKRNTCISHAVLQPLLK